MRSLSGILGLIYFASEVLLSILRRAPKSTNVREEDRSSLRVLWIVIMATIGASLYVAAHFRSARIPHTTALAVISVLLFVVGLTLRWWAIVQLGRFFTVNVAIVQNHAVIDSGPYRLVRHPSYTGLLLAFLGLGLSLGNWAALIVLLVPIFVAFLYRMKVEEEALTNALGEGYLAYSRRTKRLVPFLY